MAKSLNIIPDKCTGCMQCELACSWIQTGTFQPSQSLIRVHLFDEEASYAPYTCLQCDEAWCMNACPVNAITVDNETGAKIILPSLCIGCHLCTLACPFGTAFAPTSSAETAIGKAAKCNLCGGQPACAIVCPTRAIEFTESERTGEWFGAWADHLQNNYLATLAGTTEGGK